MEIITTSQFIRKAALKSGTVITPTPWRERPPGKKLRKSEMNKVNVNGYTGVVMTDPELADVPDEQCWLCGGQTGGRGLPRKKIIKDTFTDHDKARAPASSSVCPGCVFCLSFVSLRNYSILATENEMRHPSRAEIRDILLNPPEPPFVLCIAVSGQKHVSFKGEVAYSRDNYPVQFEETRVTVDVAQLTNLLDIIERLNTVFTKDEIKTGRYSQNRIKQFGIGEFQKLEEKLAPHRGSRLFELAIFVAQKREFEPVEKPEKEEKPCTTTLTPPTKTQQLVLF